MDKSKANHVQAKEFWLLIFGFKNKINKIPNTVIKEQNKQINPNIGDLCLKGWIFLLRNINVIVGTYKIQETVNPTTNLIILFVNKKFILSTS